MKALRTLRVLPVAILFLALNASLADEVKLKASQDGIKVGPDIVMPPPALLMKVGSQEMPTARVSGNELTLEFESGLVATLEINGGTVKCKLNEVPADAKGLRFRFMLPAMLFLNGGKFSAGDGEPVLFPADADGQFVTQGTVIDKCVLVDNDDDALEIRLPANWYGLQDNRIFNNTQSFQLDLVYDFAVHPDKTEFEVTLSRPVQKAD